MITFNVTTTRTKAHFERVFSALLIAICLIAVAIAAVAPGSIATSFAQYNGDSLNCVTWASPC